MSRKLELVWPNKDKVLLRLDEHGEPVWGTWDDLDTRLLIQQAHYGDPGAENMLIRGNNLLALQSLLASGYQSRVKFIYIDPPFNTGNAFQYYDDGFEHSIWLALLRDRLRLLECLVRNDGLICIHIDHHEYAYLKVLADEIFGRNNYIDTLSVQVRHEDRILKRDKPMHAVIEYVLLYAGDSSEFSIAKRLRDNTDVSQYAYDIQVSGEGRTERIGGKDVQIFSPHEYEIHSGKPSAGKLKKINIRGSIKEGNSSGRYYEAYLAPRLEIDGYAALYRVPGIGADALGYRYFIHPTEPRYRNGHYFQGVPLNRADIIEIPYPNFIDMTDQYNRVQEEGAVEFRNAKKPEALISFLLNLASPKPDDIVLDSFAGSGTTGAVAHKLGCKWIMVEIGEHAETLIIPRMRRLISGQDPTGISQEVGWSGGGGFTYYTLGESVVSKDAATGVWVLNYSNGPLIEAVCLSEGFEIIADGDLHGKKGHHYAHVADDHVTNEYVNSLLAQLEDHERLTVYCQSHDPYLQGNERVEIKRIPQALVQGHRK